MAASRFTGHEYLIGPGLYPWYWPTQRTVIGLVLALLAIVGGLQALASDNPWRALPQTLERAWQLGIFAFGMVTVVFVLIERFGGVSRLANAPKWDPMKLPRDEVAKPKSLFESVVGLTFDMIFVLWWVKAVPFPNQWPMTREIEAGVHFAAAWDAMWWPILVLALMQTAVHLADIVHPAWSRLRGLAAVLGYVGALGVAWVLLRAGDLVDVTLPAGAAAAEAARAGELERLLNLSLTGILGVTALVWAIALGVKVWELVRSVKGVAPTRLAC